MIKRSILLVCAATLLGVVSVPAARADIVIPARESCRTDVLNAATNRHDASKLSVRSDASSAKSWIKFNLGGLDVSALRTATLTVTLAEDKGELKVSGTFFLVFIVPPRPQPNQFVTASSKMLHQRM